MKKFTIKLTAGREKPSGIMIAMPQYFRGRKVCLETARFMMGLPCVTRRSYERYTRFIKRAADKASADYREEQLRIALSNPN